MASHQDSNRLFEGKDHSVKYQRFRPRYDGCKIVEKCMKFLEEQCAPPHQLALDLGCGSGQSTHLFAPHFKQVIGIDCSEEQIKAAKDFNTLENVSFRCGDESSLCTISDDSVDLVTCAQSIHWMDLAVLYEQIERILKPGGCLAAYSYFTMTVHVTDSCSDLEAQLQGILKEFDDWIYPHWSEKLKVLYNSYKDLPLPFSDNKWYGDMVNYHDVTIESCFGLMESFSAFQKLLAETSDGKQRFDNFRKRFTDCISKYSDEPDEYKMKYSSNHCLVLSRKPLKT